MIQKFSDVKDACFYLEELNGVCKLKREETFFSNQNRFQPLTNNVSGKLVNNNYSKRSHGKHYIEIEKWKLVKTGFHEVLSKDDYVIHFFDLVVKFTQKLPLHLHKNLMTRQKQILTHFELVARGD